MPQRRIVHIVIVLISLFAESRHLLAQEISFTQITTSYTNCIHRDHEGFIWIGTQDGLVRYDANDFRTFRNIPDDSLSLSNNFVWCLSEDSTGRMWVGTFGGGMGRWDKYTQSFKTYYCEPPGKAAVEANTIRALTIAGDSLLLLGTERGIRGFDLNREQFLSGGVWDTLSRRDWFTYAISVGPGGDIYVGTEKGLYCVSGIYSKPALTRMDLPGSDEQTVPAVLVANNVLYVGSEFGFYVSQDFKLFHDHTAEHGQGPRRVQQVYVDEHGVIWLATQQGLGRYEEQAGYQWYTEDECDNNSLKTSIIHCIGQAEPGILMAGTRQGVHQFSIDPPVFRNLNMQYESTSCSRTALGMTEDQFGNIWICSRGGLMKLNVHGDVSAWDATCFLPDNTPGMREAYTINITPDAQNDLWVAYRYNGFSKMHLTENAIQWQQFPKTVALFNGEGVNQVYQDKHGDYWIATRGFGLMKFFPERDSVKTFGTDAGLSHPYVFRVFEDKENRMWIGTANGGLCEFDRETERFTCYVSDRSDPNSLSSNMVLAVSEDSQNRLWVCTVDGLNVMDKGAGRFSVFTMMDGLPNNVMYAALEDDEGKIWLSNNEGIVRVNYDGDIREMDVFDARDGISGTEFNQHAFLKHSSGWFLLGSIDGITVWNPRDIRAIAYHPEVVLTDFLLFNSSVPIRRTAKDKGFVLDRNINDLDEIILKYNQNSVAFRFSTLGYNYSRIASYEYKMVGVDNDWTRVPSSAASNGRGGDRRYASYPGLAPGNYTFQVNVSNRDGVRNDEAKKINIHILPPPWRTWWAYMIYAMLIVAAVYALIWSQVARSRAIERAREAERDQFRKKMARDFHDEAGNKITLLSLLADRVARKTAVNPEVSQMMSEQQQYIQELRAGMRDFIWIMDPTMDTLFDTVIRFRDFAERACEQAEVGFTETGRSETLRDISMTGNVRRHFLLIFKEALNNSLKYSGANHIVFAIAKRADLGWEFTLRDDGKGFDPVHGPKGNGVDNMRARATQIGGELTLQSTPDSGTSVILRWQTDK